MDQTLNSRSDLNKCTIIGHNNNLTFHFVTNIEVRINRIPWVRSKLFQTQSYSLLIIIKIENNNIEFLVELNDLLRMINPAPGKIGDMNQAVNPTKIDK